MKNYKSILEGLNITPQVVSDEFYTYIEDNINNLGVQAYLNAKEIESIDYEDFDHRDFLKFHSCDYEILEPDLLNRDNSEVFLFLKFEDGTVLKANGYYNSYETNNYQDEEWINVKPVEKTIIVYV